MDSNSVSAITGTDSTVLVEVVKAIAVLIGSVAATYTPTHCQDKKLGSLRWIHRRVLKPLERREPVGRPECQRLRRAPRPGCGSPTPGAIAGYYKTQNICPG